MKLIDLLVQELPKHGGWPDGAAKAVSYSFIPGVHYWGGDGFRVGYNDLITHALGEEEEVTREQYEAAAQQPVWDGEGLPPVGCECEVRYRHGGTDWGKFKCLAVDKGITFGWCDDEPVTLPDDCYEFRPIRSEADKKRDAACDSMRKWWREVAGQRREDGSLIDIYSCIYHAIATGKIPGIKLSD
ncbi:hypothetical protein [Phage vB_KsaM-C1]|nr:hypothetical protein [Phage vB_KsaM-C1]